MKQTCHSALRPVALVSVAATVMALAYAAASSHSDLVVRIDAAKGLVSVRDAHTGRVKAFQASAADLASLKVGDEVKANWKIIFENNRECLHCRSNHPEYCRATFDVMRDAGSEHDRMIAQIDRLRPRLQRQGIDTSRLNVSSAMTGGGFRLNHTPLADGFVTVSSCRKN